MNAHMMSTRPVLFHVHTQAGFEIRNWVSNSSEVLTALGEEKPMSPVLLNENKQTPSERVFGVRWDTELDVFAFAVLHREELLKYLKEGERPTKRIVPSCVMGFFDPLGLLSPFTIHGKIIQSSSTCGGLAAAGTKR